jgi:hypothetical protein
MALLRLDGWNLEALIDGFEAPDQSVESFTRAINDDYVGVTYSVKKGYAFETPPLSHAAADAVEGWVRGRGHRWTYRQTTNGSTRFTKGSSDSGLSLTAGTSNATGLFGNPGLLLNSGASSSATASFGSEGNWSFQTYHRVSGGSFVSYVVRSLDGTIDFWVSGATAAGISVATVTAASGFLGMSLLGRNAAGSNATAQFDGTRLLPYALTESQILSLATPFYGLPTGGFAKAPYGVLTGSILSRGGPAVNGAGERGGQSVKGFVDSHELAPVVLDGTWSPNARRLKIRLVEK